MLCLITTLPLYSQKALSDTCRVPCATLKKALVVREERIYCGTQLGFARDSITNLQEIILSKDTIDKANLDVALSNYKRYFNRDNGGTPEVKRGMKMQSKLDELSKAKTINKETSNPESGKSAPYGSGYGV